MHTYIDKNQGNKSQSIANVVVQKRGAKPTFHHANNVQKLQETANNSTVVKPLKDYQEITQHTTSQIAQRKENWGGKTQNQTPAVTQERHLPHEAWHVAQQKQARVKPTVQMKGETHANGHTTDVIQRKVFLFSNNKEKDKTALEIGSDWFTSKPRNLTPSDEEIYQDEFDKETPKHSLVDMYKDIDDKVDNDNNYTLEEGETAIIVSHGSLGGGKNSFSNDENKIITQDVIEAVRKIIEKNKEKDQIRIFIAACNSARNELNIKTNKIGNSPIQKIISELKIFDLVKKDKVIFEGYTAQAGLNDYEKNDVGDEKVGKHIWGKNKLVSNSGTINDNDGNGQQIFGYDTEITAKAIIDDHNKIGYSKQSKPLGDFDADFNTDLFKMMSNTKPNKKRKEIDGLHTESKKDNNKKNKITNII